MNQLESIKQSNNLIMNNYKNVLKSTEEVENMLNKKLELMNKQLLDMKQLHEEATRSYQKICRNLIEFD